MGHHGMGRTVLLRVAAEASGITSVAGHRVEALGDDRSRLTVTLDMRGVPIPIVGLTAT